MKNNLVKIITDDGGEPGDGLWHLSSTAGGSPVVLCTLETYGTIGESNVTHSDKVTKRGGITCWDCLAKIKEIKAVKL